MKDIDFLVFDCMETIVDLTELPSKKHYAMWGYEGTGFEDVWQDAQEFINCYMEAVQQIDSNRPMHSEYDMRLRFEKTVTGKLGTGRFSDEIISALYENFWNNYKSRCYVSDEVRTVLENLSSVYPVGVISNFMVPGGIEELLDINGVLSLFRFVATSIKIGWRKPHKAIFAEAAEKAKVSPRQILFIGDDYINDYKGGESAGFVTLLYDRKKRYPKAERRFERFTQLDGVPGVKALIGR